MLQDKKCPVKTVLFHAWILHRDSVLPFRDPILKLAVPPALLEETQHSVLWNTVIDYTTQRGTWISQYT